MLIGLPLANYQLFMASLLYRPMAQRTKLLGARRELSKRSDLGQMKLRIGDGRVGVPEAV